MDYRFTLMSPNYPDLIIEEPQGFSDVVQGMIRDEAWAGVYFEATINQLGFYGQAALFLQEQKENFGLKANVYFLAEERCTEDAEYTELLRGRLNFGRYQSICGEECKITLPVEQEGCAMLFRNRYDQAVDLDNLTAFDRLTGLPDYAGMGIDVTLAAQELGVGVVGDVGPDGDHFSQIDIPGVQSGLSVRPIYKNKVKESINVSQLEPISQYGTYRPSFRSPTSPVLLLDENFDCFTGSFAVDIRLKGTWNFKQGLLNDVRVRIVESADNTVIPAADDNVLAETVFNWAKAGPVSRTFDLVFNNPATTLRNGFGIYTEVLFVTSPFTAPPDVDVDWDPETHFSVTATRSCPPTDNQVYLINESLSRMAEAVTNNCLRVKSDYYGRVDSQPYASGADGCGSLRVFTNGLFLRKAENAKMFMSFQEAFEGLRAIDNIGMGFEPNPELPGFDWLRIEPVDYFYKDIEVLRFEAVPQVVLEVDESKHYSIIKVGYNKWEPKAVGGLDEFNSTRQFRTSLETVRNTLDITSNLIAAGYVIETTRQQSFVETGAADTTYDNDNFIICVEREGPYGYKVEQGVIGSPANMFSPATAYNYRISPLRNLMRWFKNIVNSYANIVDSASKLFFSEGTGNYTATGQLLDPACADENGPKAENIDLSITDFLNPVDYLPLYRPENISFNYPFTSADWVKLKNNRYGYCSVQCGNGDWIKGYVTELQWNVKAGTAEIKMKVKWPSA